MPIFTSWPNLKSETPSKATAMKNASAVDMLQPEEGTAKTYNQK